jgi:hypothetical protein
LNLDLVLGCIIDGFESNYILILVSKEVTNYIFVFHTM